MYAVVIIKKRSEIDRERESEEKVPAVVFYSWRFFFIDLLFIEFHRMNFLLFILSRCSSLNEIGVIVGKEQKIH